MEYLTSYASSIDLQTCYICNYNYQSTICRNCTLIICDSNECGIHFKHKHNSLYSICNLCNDHISKKFQLSMDYSKLKCLKKRIEFLKSHKDKSQINNNVTNNE